MDHILNKLILPDNVSISEGTKELQEAFKSPDAIPGLCSAIVSSPNPQIRQLAAVVLRKKLAKHRYWSRLPHETKTFVKQGLLKSLISEQEKSVKTAIAQVIGVLLRHEMPENTWPEAMAFIQQTTTSQNINDKELGFFTLQILTEISGDQFLPHAHSFANLFSNTLNSIEDPASKLAYLVIQCMTNLVSAIENDQFMVNAFHGMIPQVMTTVKCLSKKRYDEAIESLNLIDELADFAMAVVVPHLKMIIETCLELAIDQTCNSDLQIKALNTVGMLVQSKKKQIVKLNLVEPIVHVLFRLMSVPPEDENEEEYPDLEESSSPSTVANQTLDVLALHLPPEKLLPLLIDKYVVQNIQSSDQHVRKASHLAMAVVAEGCSEYIRLRLVQTLISFVMAGLRDPSQAVSNAALFAVGQFSEHLQPDISVYASELIPFLLEHLHNITKTEDAAPVKVDRMFYALESFCENLNEGLLPFLPALMQLLVPLLSPPYAVHIRELAISAIGACANAAKEGMMPYFPQTLERLKMYLTEVQNSETMCLQVQSVDTLGILARTIGVENFMPMAKETMELGISLISNNDDPDLRKSAYGLFAAVATVLKEDMMPFLPVVLESIVSSIKSDSGVVITLKDESNPALGLFENTSEGEEDEEDLGNTSDVSSDKDDMDEAGLTVENAYLEEKEEAVIAVRDIAQNCVVAFIPYVDTCFQEISKLLNYPHDDIRSAALSTLSQLCLNLHKTENSLSGGKVLLQYLAVLVPKCAEIIRTDSERDVVIAGLDVYAELLKELPVTVLSGDGHADAIINCIKDVLNCRTECQDQGEEEGEEAEGDEMLIESAGELIPLLGKGLGPDKFAQHYTQFLPMFYNLTQKKQSSDAQRSFGVGMVAECMSVAGPCLKIYASHLLSFLESLSKDPNDEVRNNAIFALGELVYHGGECIYPFYPQILQILSGAVVVEKNSGVLDNICGALARIIIANAALIPLDQVVPVFVSYLPLREDFAENKWVYQSLTHLYQIGCESLVQNLNRIIKASAVSLHENQIEPENKEIIVNFLKKCHSDFPSECTKAASELEEPIALTLKEACVS